MSFSPAELELTLLLSIYCTTQALSAFIYFISFIKHFKNLNIKIPEDSSSLLVFYEHIIILDCVCVCVRKKSENYCFGVLETFGEAFDSGDAICQSFLFLVEIST